MDNIQGPQRIGTIREAREATVHTFVPGAAWIFKHAIPFGHVANFARKSHWFFCLKHPFFIVQISNSNFGLEKNQQLEEVFEYLRPSNCCFFHRFSHILICFAPGCWWNFQPLELHWCNCWCNEHDEHGDSGAEFHGRNCYIASKPKPFRKL